MGLLRAKAQDCQGALIADTIQSLSLRIPEDMFRPNTRPADARDRLQCFGDEKITEIAALLFIF